MSKKTNKSKPTVNAQIVGEMDRKLRWLNEGISSINKTGMLLTSPMDLENVLQIVLKTITEVLRLDAAAIRLLDDNTGKLVLKATYGLSEAYKNKGPVTATESELNRQALHGKPVIVTNMRTDPNFTTYHDEIVREGIVSSLSIGLIFRDKGIGILRLYSKRPRRFPKTDIKLAQTVAVQSAAAIVNARLYREALEADRLSRQMKLAGEVQRRLIPTSKPQIPGIDLAGEYVPCYEVGGDFYDYITLPDGRLILTMGDVMGKGIPAALAMASFRSSLRAYAEEIDSVSELMCRVNCMFCHDTDPGEFATLFFARLEGKGEGITYCNCGHEPPILIKRDGQSIDLREGGMVMGIDSQAEFEDQYIQLHQGDMLLMFTDGLTDAVNFQRESFGRKRVIQAALESRQMSAQQAAKNIIWLMRKFTGLTERFDDTALVIMKKL